MLDAAERDSERESVSKKESIVVLDGVQWCSEYFDLFREDLRILPTRNVVVLDGPSIYQANDSNVCRVLRKVMLDCA